MHENRPLIAIRGIAALYVVCYHLNVWVQPGTDILPRSLFGYGYVAVDVFFVLSGFILASVYGDMALTVGELWRFATKRILRLYPLHVAIMGFLAVAVAVSPYLHVPMHSDQFHAWHAFPYVLFLVQPFTANQIGWNNPSWSIGIELLCYAAFPAGVVVLRRVPAKFVMGAAAVLAVLQMHLLLTAFDATNGAEAVLRGLFGFFLGVTLRLTLASLPRPSDAVTGLAGIAAIACAVGAAAVGAANLIPLACAALIGTLLTGRGVVGRILSAKPLVWLGRVSFSIYLLHDPVVRIMGKLLPLSHLPLPMPLAGWVYSFGVLAMVTALAAVTNRWIEEPARNLLRSRHHAIEQTKATAIPDTPKPHVTAWAPGPQVENV